MQNREVIERTLTPEYWNGHFSQDTCPAKISRFNAVSLIRDAKRHAQMKNRLREQLAEHEMLEKGNYVPFSEFKSGIFCPDQYPHGTIIRVRSETLYLYDSHPKGEDVSYGMTKQFGFIVDTSGITKDGKNAVIYMKDGIICGGDFQNIKIGEVKHQKLSSPEGKIIYNLVEKVNSVEIVLPGSGIKEKRRIMTGRPCINFAPELQI
jgi:hypothetical protein